LAAAVFCLVCSLRFAGVYAQAPNNGDGAAPKLYRRKTIRVVNPEGEPVASARVEPWAIRSQQGHGSWAPEGQGRSTPPKLTTDAKGEVVIPFPRFADRDGKFPVQEITCRVDHPDYAESVYNDVPVGEVELADVHVITLKRGDQITIAALTEEGPLPIEHVYAQWSSPSHGGSNNTFVTSDGMRRLPRLAAGPELLRLAYLPKNDDETMFSIVHELTLTEGKRRRLRVYLEPAARVEGRLNAAVPRPVTGGRVVADVIHRLQGTDEYESLHWRTWSEVRADGTFSLPPLPAGELQVIALCDGFIAQSGLQPAFVDEPVPLFASPFLRPQVFTVAGGRNEIELAMTRTADCRFHVVDPDGQPIESAHVAFWPNVGWWAGGSQIYCSPRINMAERIKQGDKAPPIDMTDRHFAATTDARGIALVKNIPSGDRPFAVTHEGWELWVDADRYQSGRVTLKAGETAEVKLAMQPREAPHDGNDGERDANDALEPSAP
jgi:hypothetical protein